jgi:hypothetical protein
LGGAFVRNIYALCKMKPIVHRTARVERGTARCRARFDSLPPLPRLRGPGPLQRWRERAIQAALFFAAASSIAITLGIVGILGFESLAFFKQVSSVHIFNGHPVDAAF